MTEPVREPFGFRFVSPLLIGTLLNPVNSAMIATALVPIGRDLNAGPASTVWLVAALHRLAPVLAAICGVILLVTLADRGLRAADHQPG